MEQHIQEVLAMIRDGVLGLEEGLRELANRIHKDAHTLIEKVGQGVRDIHPAD